MIREKEVELALVQWALASVPIPPFRMHTEKQFKSGYETDLCSLTRVMFTLAISLSWLMTPVTSFNI